VLFRAAAPAPVDAAVLERIETLLGLTTAGVLHYADARRGQRRSMRLAPAGDALHQEAFLLAGDISAEAWVKPLLQEQLPAQAFGRLLLIPGAQAPLAAPSRGRQVCSCLDVTDLQIAAALSSFAGAAPDRLGHLQQSLGCGTNCGSCLPEVRRAIQLHAAAAAAAA
jgi:assimilatory nitrate reductase catalytic subunit